MSSVNLITNALLAVTWEHSKKDYLDIIAPFVIYSAYHEVKDETGYIDVPELTTYVNKEFKLHLVDTVTICILNRNKNFFEKKGKPVSYFIIAGKYNIQEFEDKRINSRRNYEYFINQMQKFLLEKTGRKFEDKKLEEKLTKFISTNYFDLLNFNNKIISYRDNELALFISYILDNDEILKNILIDIVKGQMIYEALYAQQIDKADIKQKFNNLYVYLDTTFIFYMLGYGGKRYKEYILQIIDLLTGLGANLRCFKHTVDEVRGILEKCESAMRHGNEKSLVNLDWFLENGMQASDVMILISSLDVNISKYLKIVDTPDYSEPMKNIDWVQFSQYLEEKINYRREKALQNDVESIAAIFRLRTNKHARTLENCNAIFVTTNQKLVRAVKYYQKIHDDMKGFYPCISEYEISNIAWLKTPSKQDKFVNNSLKFSASILKEPSPAFWKRFAETVDKFQSEGAITLENATELKYELYSKRNTAEILQEDDCEITLESLQQILDRNQRTQHNKLVNELEKKNEKISQLKNEDITNADIEIKNYGKLWKGVYIFAYIFSLLAALTLACCSILDLAIDLTNSPFKFVFIIEILGVAVTFFIPKVKDLWHIKAAISASVDKKVEKKKSELYDAIEKKYAELD